MRVAGLLTVRLCPPQALLPSAAALLNPYLADSPIERLRLSDTVGRSFANGWLRDRKGQLRDGGFCYGAIGERTLPMTARLRSVKHFPKGNI